MNEKETTTDSLRCNELYERLELIKKPTAGILVRGTGSEGPLCASVETETGKGSCCEIAEEFNPIRGRLILPLAGIDTSILKFAGISRSAFILNSEDVLDQSANANTPNGSDITGKHSRASP
jgi:hypothetical protein